MPFPIPDPAALLAEDRFVRRLAWSLLHDEHRAEDVAQEAWLAAMESPPEPRGGVRGWLTVVARNAARLAHRRDARRQAREQRAARPEGVPSVSEVAEREETRRRVVAAVLSLDPPSRDVILLRFFEGCPPREIARRLGIPVNTARSRTRRAIEELRTRFDGEHRGDRRAWATALVPLAGLPRAGFLAAIGRLLAAPSVRVAAVSLVVVIAALLTWRMTRGADEASAPGMATARQPPSPAARPGLAAVPGAAGASHAAGAPNGEDVAAPLARSADSDTVFLRRFVEAATGKPVAGAAVKLFCEVPHPEPGFGTPAAAATSGPDGWVRIRKQDIDARIAATFGPPTWAYVEAPGLRPDAVFQDTEKPRLDAKEVEAPGDFTPVDPDWHLGRSTTIRIALRDPLDRPVAGALVGWLLGCGHTPDVREARSGPDGVAVLDRVGAGRGLGQIWPLAEGLRAPANYLSDEGWTPWERPRIAALTWSMTIEGTVLAHDGKPAANVAVGYPSCHRGPWTHTGKDGRFRLLGTDADPGYTIYVEVGDYVVGPASAPKTGLVTAIAFRAPPPGFRAVVRLPEPGKEPEDEPDAARLVVEPDLTGWPKSKAAPAIWVHAVRVDDGWTVTGPVGEEGVALLDVPPGAYVVEALGERGMGEIVYSRARAEVTVPATGGARAKIAMPPPAVQPLDIEWPESAPFFEDVAAVVDGATTLIQNTTEDGRHVEVLLPTDRAVFVRVSQGARTRLVALDRKALLPGVRAPEVSLAPFAPIEIRARFLDGDGNPAAGWLFESDPSNPSDAEDPPAGDASPTPSATIASGDRATLVAWPEDGEHFQPSSIEVAPAAAPSQGKPLDLGGIRLTPRSPALRLEDADGKPYESATVLVTSGDRSEDLTTGKGAWASCVVDPWSAPGLLVEGSLVRVPSWERAGDRGENEYDVPFTRRLEGPGPWTIREPKGSMTVTVRGEGDSGIEAWSAWLDDHIYAAKGPRLRLATLDAGPHELVVDAKGRTPRRLQFTLADGERREWTASLNPVAKAPK